MKKVIMCSILLLMLQSFIFPNNIVCAEIPLTDNNLTMDINVYLRDTSAEGNDEKIIENGIPVGSDPVTIEQGRGVMFEILWSLQNAKSYNANDQIIVPIPEEYFVFNFTNEEIPIKLENGQTVGTFQVVRNIGVIITLNEFAVSNDYLENGFIRFTGRATTLNSDIKEIVVGGKVIELEIIETTKDQNTIINRGLFHKNGRQIEGTNSIRWEILVNIDNYKDAFIGENYDLLENVIVTDTLGAIQSIGNDYSYDKLKDRIEITMPIYAATKDGELSDYRITTAEIVLGIPTIMVSVSTNNETLDEFLVEVTNNTDKYVWGIYETKDSNGQVIVIKLPDMKDVVLEDPKDTVEDLANYFDSVFIKEIERTNTFDAYNALQIKNGGKIPVLAYRITIVTDPLDLDAKGITNTANLKYGTNNELNQDFTVDFSKYESGVGVGNNGQVTIKKTDGETNDNITGAKFKLQVYDNSVSDYVDYVPNDGPMVRETVNGTITFNDLPIGRYKVVEVEVASGYDENRVEFVTSDTFTVMGTEPTIVEVSVKNYKLPDIPLVPETGIGSGVMYYVNVIVLAVLTAVFMKSKYWKQV